MKYKEKKQVVDMLYNQWDLGKTRSHAKGKTAAWIYLYEILEESEEIVLEKVNGEVVGVCGYAKWNSKKHFIKKKFYHLLKTLLIHSPLIKDKKAIIQYNLDYDYVPDNLRDYFDGEISIIIVNEKYRGKGIGKKMILEIFDKAQKNNMKNLQILADESCDFTFYEHLGCVRVYETTVYSGELDKNGKFVSEEQAYIYEKKFV